MKSSLNILTSMQSYVLALLSCILILGSCEGCVEVCDPPCGKKNPKPKASYGPPIIHSPAANPVECYSKERDYYESTNLVKLNLARLDTITVQDTILAILGSDSALMVLKSRKDEPLDKAWHFGSADSFNGKAVMIYRGGDSLSSEGFLTSDLSYAGNDYELHKCDQGSYLLGKVDNTALTAYDRLRHVSADSVMSEGNCAMTYGNAVIDLMVLYTDAVRDELTTLGAEAEIMKSIANANESFVNSGIPVKLNLNYIGEYMGYPDRLESNSLDLQYKLESLIVDDPIINDLRENYQSDLYIVFVKNADSTYNGYASVSKGGAVLRTKTASQRYMLAHEIGHLLIGDQHDNSCRTIVNGEEYQTIMGNDTTLERAPLYFFEGQGCSDSILNKIIAGAHIVATRRCPMLVREALIQDYFHDNGLEPSIAKANSPQLFSPQLYVRNERDSMRMHLYHSQDPIIGQDNYLYVIVRNGSTRIVNGSLTAYQNCRLISSKMSELSMIQTVTDINISSESIQVIEIRIPAGTLSGIDCGFVAQFHEENTPEPFPGNEWVTEMVKNRNQVAGRSASEIVLNVDTSSSSINSFVAFDPCSSVKTLVFRNMVKDSIRIWYSPAPETNKTFLDAGGTLNYSFQEDSTFFPISSQVINPNLSLQEVKIPITQRFPGPSSGTSMFYFTVCSSAKMESGSYPIHIEQWQNTGIIGSHTYILKVSNSNSQ